MKSIMHSVTVSVMKASLKTLIIFIALGNSVWAQSGFLGKVHALHTDIFRAVYEKQYGLDYKFSLARHTAFFLSAGYVNRSEDILAGQVNFRYQNTEVYVLDQPGHHKSSGPVIALGILYNNAFTNMSMPIGYYSGVMFETHLLSSEENYTINEQIPYPANVTVPYSGLPYDFKSHPVSNKYRVSSRIIKFVLGRSHYIAKNICTDFGLEFGARWIKGKIISGSSYESLNRIYPQHQAWSLYTDGNSNGGAVRFFDRGTDTFYAFTFYFTPLLRVGYMF